MPKFDLVELVVDGIKHRNTIVDTNSIKHRIAQSKKYDCHVSMFLYSNDVLKHIENNNGSIGGYDGVVAPTAVYIDIDGTADTLGITKDVCRKFVLHLSDKFGISIGQFHIYFSGNKGFHIALPHKLFGLEPCPDLPAKTRHIVEKLVSGMEESDKQLFDMQIYNKTRIMRYPNTINPKSSLYKIKIEYENLDESAEKIKEMAKNPQDITPIRFDESTSNMLAYLLEGYNEPARNMFGDIKQNKFDSRKLYGTKLCLWDILVSGVDEGLRDASAIRLATDFRKKGMSPDMAYGILVSWNRLNRGSGGLSSEDLHAKIESAYRGGIYDYGCKDSILCQFCHEGCYLYKNKDKSSADDVRVWTIAEMADEYKELLNDPDRSFSIQLNYLPNANQATGGIRRGEVTIDAARTGCAKSARLQTFAQEVANKQGIKTLLFSLEMPNELTFERAMMIETGWGVDYIQESFRNGDLTHFSAPINRLNNLYVVDQPALTLDDIESIIERVGDVGFVCIDYMTLVKSTGQNSYEKMSSVARQLKEMAKRTKTAVYMLAQLSRAGGDGTEPVTMTMIRDSGQIEECADVILGSWWSDKDSKTLSIVLLKNRKGEKDTLDKLRMAKDSMKLGKVEDRI